MQLWRKSGRYSSSVIIVSSTSFHWEAIRGSQPTALYLSTTTSWYRPNNLRPNRLTWQSTCHSVYCLCLPLQHVTTLNNLYKCNSSTFIIHTVVEWKETEVSLSVHSERVVAEWWRRRTSDSSSLTSSVWDLCPDLCINLFIRSSHRLWAFEDWQGKVKKKTCHP